MAICGYSHDRDGTSTLLTEEMKKGRLSGTVAPQICLDLLYILCVFPNANLSYY